MAAGWRERRQGGLTIDDITGDPAWNRTKLWPLIRARAEAHPEKEFLVAVDDEGIVRRVSYGEFVQMAERFSAGLVEVGAKRGDRIGLLMTNLVEWVITYFAALRIGGITVPISSRLKTPEIAYILDKAEVQHLVILDSFRKRPFYEMVRSLLRDERASIETMVTPVLQHLRNLVVLQKRSASVLHPADLPFSRLAQPREYSLRQAARIAESVQPEDVALIKFTSGSTAFPKGAVLEQWGIATNALLHARRLDLQPGDRWFSSMPFFHAGGSIWGLMTMVATGGTLVFTEAFDAQTALSLIESERCTVQFGVGPMIRDEVEQLKKRGHSLKSLRLCVRGDAALVDDVHQWLGAERVFSAYGATEAYGPTSVLGPYDPPEKSRTQGRFLDGVEHRVVDPATGVDVAAGEVGECLIRRPVMRGYFNDPEQTSRTIDADGWFHTHDLVRLDSDGFVTFVGRLSTMIKVGGENVAPEEVEDCIRRLPFIRECCVVGVQDERKGEIPRAYLVLMDGESQALRLGDVRNWCLDHLAGYKIPQEFIIVESLPMTGPGKVDRAALMNSISGQGIGNHVDREAHSIQLNEDPVRTSGYDDEGQSTSSH